MRTGMFSVDGTSRILTGGGIAPIIADPASGIVRYGR